MKRTLSLKREALASLEPGELRMAGGTLATRLCWVTDLPTIKCPIEAPTRDAGLCQTYTVTQRSVCICDA